MAAAQKFNPKSIQFKGDPEYSDAELLAAAGLKKGVVLDAAEMKDYAQRLQATGMFATLAFKFDGRDLIFELTPNPAVYPIRLANLPLTPGPELDAQLHDIVPLYHGKVPADGGLVEDVRAALQKILAGRGITAKVTATAATSRRSGAGAIVSYQISDLQVQVGKVQITGVSDQYLKLVQDTVKKVAAWPFGTVSSSTNLESEVEALY